MNDLFTTMPCSLITCYLLSTANKVRMRMMIDVVVVVVVVDTSPPCHLFYPVLIHVPSFLFIASLCLMIINITSHHHTSSTWLHRFDRRTHRKRFKWRFRIILASGGWLCVCKTLSRTWSYRIDEPSTNLWICFQSYQSCSSSYAITRGVRGRLYSKK